MKSNNVAKAAMAMKAVMKMRNESLKAYQIVMTNPERMQWRRNVMKKKESGRSNNSNENETQ